MVPTMRVLMFSSDAHGHFTPLVQIGRALQSSGHDVAVVTAKEFSGVVNDHGFQSIPAGISGDQAFARAYVADPTLATATAAEIGRRLIPDVFVAQKAASVLESADVLMRWRP